MQMATCNDCIHYSVCMARTHENTLCDHFKNKADVVPVVKCSQCRKRYTTECALWYATMNDTEYFVERGKDFFCSYGEKK